MASVRRVSTDLSGQLQQRYRLSEALNPAGTSSRRTTSTEYPRGTVIRSNNLAEPRLDADNRGMEAIAHLPQSAASSDNDPLCPLCHADAQPFQTVDRHAYFACQICGLRFLSPTQRPTREEELATYLHHENDPHDPRYRHFLSRLATPLLYRLPEPSSGLDYGCGQGSALAAMLREAGHDIRLYDPFFAPNAGALDRTYDFVTCTEAAEHFHHPHDEFARMMALVRPGGFLGLMTCFQSDDMRFASWRYRADPTHVTFYQAETFRWLADRHGWSCEIPVKDVVLMRRPDVCRGVA